MDDVGHVDDGGNGEKAFTERKTLELWNVKKIFDSVMDMIFSMYRLSILCWNLWVIKQCDWFFRHFFIKIKSLLKEIWLYVSL